MAAGSAEADKARARLDRLRVALEAEIRGLLARLDTKRGEAKLESDRQALQTANAVRDEVLRVLGDMGAVVADDAGDLGREAAKAAGEELPEGFKPQPERGVGIATDRIEEILTVFKGGAEAMSDAIARGVSSGLQLGDLMEQVAGELGTTIERAKAAVDTAIMGAAREVTREAARAAAEEIDEPVVLLYVGPSDPKTRPFCRARLGECFTEEALDSEDNDTGPQPPSIYLGGYNCRHGLAPMPLSLAVSRGYKIHGA